MPNGAYTPHSLSDSIMSGVAGLVDQAKAGRLVLYLGAGVSRASPSNGPMGPEVANRLRHEAADLLDCSREDLEDDTLEELASKVASLGADALSRFRSLAATAYDFAGLEPNYGHRAIAMLMREGLAKVISVNWDCAVERAGTQIGMTVAGITSVLQAQSITNEVPLFKVHGCARAPQSLKITREEVDEPQSWAVAKVHSALTSGTIVFAGLATVGDYVSDPIQKTLEEWSGYAGALRIVAPDLPPAWETVLGHHIDGSHFAAPSDEFFDDLLRAIMLDCLAHVAARAHNLADLDAWATPMATGVDSLRTVLQPIPAHLILTWWRDGVVDTQAGRPFITDLAGQSALMAIALLAGIDGSVEAVGRGRRFGLRTPSQYLEIISRPGGHLTEIMPVALDRAERRWDDGAYEEARTISYVVIGAVGSFPACDAVADIAGADDVDNDIGADVRPLVRFVSAEEAVQGRLAG